tara:strand:- start:267 stop:392 length:126 start_codon:yes stop_codon:yes gene_type:complete
MKSKENKYEEIFIADNKIDAKRIAKKSNPNSEILGVIWTYK